MELNKDNYFSTRAEQTYFSASQIKSFMNCQAQALAEIKGEYKRPESDSLLIGSYVDAYFEGSMDNFTVEHPEIFNSRTGELKAGFKKADLMIERAEADPVFMDYMDGEKQVIKTGTLFGMPFKAKFDVYQPGKRIVDLKTVKDLEPVYSKGAGMQHPIEFWKWDLQLAIYQALEGSNLPCYLAVITKEDPSDLALFQIPQPLLDASLELLKEKLPLFDAIKQGVVEPEHCGSCAYCRQTHKLTGPEVFVID